MSHTERNEVLRHSAAAHATTVGAILGSSRLRKDCEARRECALKFRARGLSLPEIGRQLNRHHTTVMQLVGERAERYPRYLLGKEGAA